MPAMLGGSIQSLGARTLVPRRPPKLTRMLRRRSGAEAVASSNTSTAARESAYPAGARKAKPTCKLADDQARLALRAGGWAYPLRLGGLAAGWSSPKLGHA